MRARASWLIAIALLIAPVLCIAAICDLAHAHDCCPKSESTAICPVNTLATAKAQPLQAAEISIDITIQPVEYSAEPVAPLVAILTRDLNIQNRVLRI